MRKFGKKNIDSHIVINHEVDDIRDKYLDENFVMFDKQTNSKLLSQNYTNDTIKSSQFNENFENLFEINKINKMLLRFVFRFHLDLTLIGAS